MRLLELTDKGLYCPIGNFYIDPWKPVDYAVISHGHSDHARWGMKHYLCHHYTKPIIQLRLGADISVESVGYNEPIYIHGIRLTFHPAGHIVGSSQIRLEYQGHVTVFSGDYKVQDDELSTPIEVVKCHEFITECTFGLPIYNWLPIDTINGQMADWVLGNKQQQKTSVFIGYSLGKAQRILKALDGLGEIYVHYTIANLNRAIESCDISLPPYQTAFFNEDTKKLKNKIVILPPSLLDSNILKKIPEAQTAICSGWMRVRGSRRWRSADAGFAASDHADWNGLLSTIKATEAETVYTTHGYTASFSKYLNEIGIHSEEIHTQYGEEEEKSEENKNEPLSSENSEI